MLTIEVGPAVSDGATATQPNPHHQAGHLDYIARSARIAAVAWRYKDAAKAQARQGMITWAQYRAFASEVDRIKRARLSALRGELRDAEAQPDRSSFSAIENMTRQRPHQLTRGGGWSTRCTCGQWVTPKTAASHLLCDTVPPESGETRAARRAAVEDALRRAPALSDREIARHLGVDHKTVASARRRLVESGEIPHFLRRVDPRSGRMSQPSTRCAQRTSATVELAGVV